MFRAADYSTPIHRYAIAPLPEARAVCSNSASTDLCGGRRVTVVPTATLPILLSFFCVSGAESKPEGTPDGFQRLMQNECARDQALIREGGIRAE